MTDSVGVWLAAAGRIPLLTAAEEIHLGQAIRLWLDHPDGRDAAPRAVQRRGQRATNRMVAGNLRLVGTIVGRYRHRLRGSAGLSHEDLLQEGCLGLHRAVEKFDPTKGYKFSTYAYWWISQALGRVIDNSASTIRVSVAALQIARRYRYRDHGVTLEQFAEQEGLAVDRVRQVLTDVLAAEMPVSLDARVQTGDDDASCLADILSSPEVDPLAGFDHGLAVSALEAALPEDLKLVEQREVLGLRPMDLAALMGYGSVSAVRFQVTAAKRRLRAAGGEQMRGLVA